MARKNDRQSSNRSGSFEGFKKTARENLTTPNLLAAGAVALGAAAFAYLRDEQRRTGLADSARRGRDAISRRWQDSMSRRQQDRSGSATQATA